MLKHSERPTLGRDRSAEAANETARVANTTSSPPFLLTSDVDPPCGQTACCSTCAPDIPVLRKERDGYPKGPAGLPPAYLTRLGPGAALPPAVRTQMEDGFAADFSNVRVHQGEAADQAAAAVQARAFTVASDIVLAADSPPADTFAGRHLLAHELGHVVQQRGATLPTGGDSLAVSPAHDAGEGAADAAADAVVRARPAPPQPSSAAAVQRSAASDLISSHTSWMNLDEDELGKALLVQVRKLGNYDFVQNVLDELGWGDRDDVSEAFTVNATESDLDSFAANERGRRMLDRMVDELTTGHASAGENAQAERIMAARTRRVGVKDFAKQLTQAKMFPFRLPGLTVLNDAPISAERRAGGKVWVKYPVRTSGMSIFAAEFATLPFQVAIGGIELPEDEIVGVKLYDMGGVVIYRPAIVLVQLSNQTDTTVVEKMAEASFIGLTLGTGGVATAAAEATWAARAVVWADRAALVLSTAISLVREHRGWILERFGQTGARFLQVLDWINAVVAVYGFARAAVGAVQLFTKLLDARRQLRSSAEALETKLSDSERAITQQLGQSAEETATEAARIRLAQSRSTNRAAEAEMQLPTAAEDAAAGTTAAESGATARHGHMEPGNPSHPGIPVAEVEAGALARKSTIDGAHEVSLTADGQLVRCSPICARLRDAYATELQTNARFQKRLDAIEESAKRAAKQRNKADAEKAVADAVALEKELLREGYDALQRSHPSLTPDNIVALRERGVTAANFTDLMNAGATHKPPLTVEDAMLIAEIGGYFGVRNARVKLQSAEGSVAAALDAGETAATAKIGIRPPASVKRHDEIVTEFKGATIEEAYDAALHDARIQSELGDLKVPFKQQIGPEEVIGTKTGYMAPDGSHGWRIDLDEKTTKGFHINWWRVDDKGYHSGANVIGGGDKAAYTRYFDQFNPKP